MGNRLLKQQHRQPSKTYEVRSGSLYTKKMGTLVRNMKQVCNKRVGEGINSLPSVKAHPGCVFAHLFTYAIVRSTWLPSYEIYSYQKS